MIHVIFSLFMFSVPQVALYDSLLSLETCENAFRT